ncbi:ABC transporter permease subunit [Methylocella sp.]|uniref:ABC transporter permease subunit n=1 Tax=Methylocella sp. TaxID=1978226 RepID=UPI0037831853
MTVLSLETSAGRRREAPLAGLARAAAGAILPLGLLVVWEGMSRAGLIAGNVLPAPSAVLAAGIETARSGELAQHLWVSAARAFAGLVVGGAIGFVLGVVNGVSDAAHRYTDTTLQMARNVPHLALIPLVILWFGIGEESKLFLVALGVFFPLYINTLHGVRSVDPQLVEMGRAYGMGRLELFRTVILPGALPSVFVGLRFALGVMWLTLIVAETISSETGLGHMAMQAREFLQTDVVVLAILIYALLGKVADVATRALEGLFLGWRPEFQRVGGAK